MEPVPDLVSIDEIRSAADRLDGVALRTPLVPFVPILGILFNGYMMYKLGWINWARLIIWLAIGLVIYFSYSRHHSLVQKGDRTAR